MRFLRPALGAFLTAFFLASTAGSKDLSVPDGANDAFVDRAAASGLAFTHFNGMSGEYYLLEVMGAGAGFLDYDNDGDLDVYLVQGRMLGENRSIADALFPPDPGTPLSDRLFRNDLSFGAGGVATPTFTDVTATSGLDAGGYGMGIAVGDYDNNGWVDLYVTNFGSNQLWHNNGDGTFQDVTEASGTGDSSWSVPAAFVNLDDDEWLDLYVGNYVDFHLSMRAAACATETGAPDYCGPLAYQGLPDRLFRNRGDGTFQDVSRPSGLDTAAGGALGLATADFDRDGRTDIYVANDMTPNLLWLNQGEGRLIDEAVLAGCAVNLEGKPEASMGTAVADFDGDGDQDIFMTHLTGETNTLYVNDGTGFFSDSTRLVGLGNASWSATGFGTAWIDYDNDGDLDLVAANGAVRRIEQQVDAGVAFPLNQPNQLFLNLGNGHFEDISSQTGPAFALSEVSRGLAAGDVDNDGDPDFLLTNNNGPVRLLVNQTAQIGHIDRVSAWLGIELTEGANPSAAIGAVASVTRENGGAQFRRVDTGGSYASARDPRLLFGLGVDDATSTLAVTWPRGRRQIWPALRAKRYYRIQSRMAQGEPE